MVIGGKHFADSGRTYVMGILNVTPDSFSDGGKYNSIDSAVRHVECMIEDGADIIDIGAESTRPGFEPVGDDEELKRLIPVIDNIKKRFDIPLSIDTFHSRVAGEALASGADMINDIWGLKYRENDIPMAEVIKKNDAAVCIMHNSGNVYKSDDNDKTGFRIINDGIVEELRKSLDIAKCAGIDKEKIMIDPGVGFAKDYNVNMGVIANLDIFKDMGYPVLLGTSNKSVIGLTLDLPVNERTEGTLATTACAVMGGCSFVRVHDVKSNVRFIKMLESILMFRYI